LPCRELNPHPRWMAFSPQKRSWIQSNKPSTGMQVSPYYLLFLICFQHPVASFLSFLSSSLPRALKLPEHLHAASPALADSRRLTCISSSRLDRRHPTFLLLVAAVCALAAGFDPHSPARCCSALSFLESIGWRSTARSQLETSAPGIATSSWTIFRLPSSTPASQYLTDTK
jgi:hypothetical protein